MEAVLTSPPPRGALDNVFFFENQIWGGPYQKRRHCRQGETCPICLDPCLSAKRTWITWCGHVFHKACLRDYYRQDAGEKCCPMCRGHAGNLEFLDGMRIQPDRTRSALDLLDETDNLIPRSCRDGTHFLGMDGHCPSCRSYRASGMA